MKIVNIRKAVPANVNVWSAKQATLMEFVTSNGAEFP